MQGLKTYVIKQAMCNKQLLTKVKNKVYNIK